MKKYLPIGLLAAGVLVVGLVIVAASVKKSTPNPTIDEEETEVREVPVEKRPYTSLVPSADGHWLKLSVDGINVDEAASLDYELLYKVKDGRTQGVPGTVQLKEDKNFNRDILLGSESSGKFRYDEGVSNGSLTLRFRNSGGKLLGKLSTDFHLQSGSKELSSVDGNFKYTLDKVQKGVFFVVMRTFGKMDNSSAKFTSGDYAIFSSSDASIKGTLAS